MWRLMWLFGVACGLFLSSVLRAQDRVVPPPPKPMAFEEDLLKKSSEELPPPVAPKVKVINQGTAQEMIEEIPSGTQVSPKSYLTNVTTDFYRVLYRMYDQHNYEPGFGHTSAVSVLVSCLPGGDNNAKADLLNKYIKYLPAGADNNVRKVAIDQHLRNNRTTLERSREIAMLAAILACKTGNSEMGEVLTRLEYAFWELSDHFKKTINKDFEQTVYNLIAAAQLMTY